MFSIKNCLAYFLRNKITMSMLFIWFIMISFFGFFTSFAGDTCEELPTEEQRLDCYEREIKEAEEKKSSISDKLLDIRGKKEDITGEISGLLSKISVTQSEINSIQNKISTMVQMLAEIKTELGNRNKKLDAKIKLRNKVLRSYYRTGTLNSLEMFATLLPSSGKSAKLLNEFTGFRYSAFRLLFGESIANEATDLIEVLGSEISQFEKDKKEAELLKNELEVAQSSLFSAKKELDQRKLLAEQDLGKLEEEESSTEKVLFNIQNEIQKLSSRQQAIISAKAGEGIVSGYEAADYKLPDPPFKPAFAAMSYGAYTHYNGMSQYGAKGRADDGDSYKEILEHYYGTDVEKKDDFPDKINVSGYGKMDFDDYLYGIAEMPSSWPMDALKAQAIAARSYAYNYTKNGGSICTTQSCQVFLKSKSDNPPSDWKKAVDKTRGMILDDPDTTQYSSTTGGYLNQSGWDVDGGKDDWPGDAYEKKAGSPWFYKAWYTKSYSDSSSTCDRSTPWLKEEEMADILNTWVVWRKGSDDEKDHISPVTTSCWGGDPYSNSKMENKANKYGGSYSDIKDVSVQISDGGYTSKVKFKTDKGDVTIDGGEFKTVFNLRAPAYVAIRSRLFDIEVED